MGVPAGLTIATDFRDVSIPEMPKSLRSAVVVAAAAAVVVDAAAVVQFGRMMVARITNFQSLVP